MAALQRPRFFLGISVFLLVVVAFATVGSARMTCVQYVRALTDFEIRGDGWMWWHRAQGVYPRGKRPRIGGVMVFGRQGNLPYGHVAVVSDIIDSRTVLVNHSWVRRLGLRCNALVVDTSAANDWSRVRVWHGPTNRLGVSHYRILGFVYPKDSRDSTVISLGGEGADGALSNKLPPHFVWCKPRVIPAQKPALLAAADAAAEPAPESLIRVVANVRKPVVAPALPAARRQRIPVHIRAAVGDVDQTDLTDRADRVQPASAVGVERPGRSIRGADRVIPAVKPVRPATAAVALPDPRSEEAASSEIRLAAVPDSKPVLTGTGLIPARKPTS